MWNRKVRLRHGLPGMQTKQLRFFHLGLELLLIFLALLSLSPNPALAWSPECLNPDGDCQFYPQCLEESHECGAKGYALGYGHKYCMRFSEQQKFSSQGKRWVLTTRQCLQDSLVPFVTPPWQKDRCEEIMDVAFDSHPNCYTQNGSSICDLPIPDVILIVETIQKPDLVSPRGLKQILSVAQTCVTHNQLILRELQKFHRHSTQPEQQEQDVFAPEFSESRFVSPSSGSSELFGDLGDRIQYWTDLANAVGQP
ncbi:MAG: hypothetical protein ACO3A2_06310 [Bdellovibrionia bacterium]